MNLRKLKKEFGTGVEVSRDGRKREVTVEACGLGYRVAEGSFENEREMAEYLKSKIPHSAIRTPQSPLI